MADAPTPGPRPGRLPGPSRETDYVSRGGAKLEHALRSFAVDVTGLRCADLGCSTGGFTDCLLRHGAAHVIAVDTGYGVLAWRLRSDSRVTVRERENALHAIPPDEPVDLVTIDLGWTPQRLALPAALGWIGASGRIMTLVKPHYEASDAGHPVPRGGLADDVADAVLERIVASMEQLGARPIAVVESPIRGAKSARRGAGNREFVVLAEPTGGAGPVGGSSTGTSNC